MFSKDDTNILKGIAILLLAYHHLFAFPDRIHYDYYSIINYNELGVILFKLGKIGVGIFLILGGYGTYKSYKGDNLGFISKKLIKLYKMYWKVFLITIPISILLKSPIINTKFDVLFLNVFGIKITYCKEWWFLSPYVVISIMSPLLIKFVKNSNIGVIFFILILIISKFCLFDLRFLINYKNTFLYSALKYLLECLPSYLCGLLFAKYNLLDKLKIKFEGNHLFGFISILVLLIIPYLQKTFFYCNLIFVIAIFVCFIIIMEMSIFKSFKNLFLYIGKQSANIWLIHTFYCYHWCQKFIFFPRYAILIFFLLVAISYISGIIIDYIYGLIKYYFVKLIDFFGLKIRKV